MTERRGTGQWLVILAGTALTVLSVHCFKEPLSPVAPTWDVSLTVPLINRAYSLEEIIRRDTSMLKAGTDGLLFYRASSSTSPTYLQNVRAFDPVPITTSFRVGPFAVTVNPFSMPLSIPLLPPGAVIPLPDTTVTLPSSGYAIPTVQQATFRGGMAHLTLRNDLPIPVDVVAPVYCRDAFNNVIVQFVFAPARIPAMSSATATADLAGRTVTGDISITGVRLHIDRSLTPIQVPLGPPLTIGFQISGGSVSRAVLSEVPEQPLAHVDSTQIMLDDSTMVQEVRIGGGSLRLQFTNTLQLTVRVRYGIRELYRTTGGLPRPYSDSIQLPALGSAETEIDLTGMLISSGGSQLLHSVSLHSSLGFVGTTSGVTLDEDDGINVRIAEGQTIVADSIIGVIKPTLVSLDRVVGLDFGGLPRQFSGSLTIPEADLRMWSLSPTGFPYDLDVRLGVRRPSTGDSVFLALPVTQRKGIAPGQILVFDRGDVGRFLSSMNGTLPDSMRAYGSVLLNPPELYNPTPAGVAAIGRNTPIGGSVDVSIPLRLTIQDGRLCDTVSIGDSTADGRRDFQPDRSRLLSAASGRLLLEIHNGLPLQLGISVRFLDAEGRSVLTLPRVPGLVAPASVSSDGTPVAPARSRVDIELANDDLRAFQRAESAVYDISLATTPTGNPVRLRTTDEVRVRAWSSFSTTVKP